MVLKNNFHGQKLGLTKKFRHSDSDCSISFKKPEKYMEFRETAYDKIKQHIFSSQSQERIEMNIQRILHRNGGKLFVVQKN